MRIQLRVCLVVSWYQIVFGSCFVKFDGIKRVLCQIRQDQALVFLCDLLCCLLQNTDLPRKRQKIAVWLHSDTYPVCYAIPFFERYAVLMANVIACCNVFFDATNAEVLSKARLQPRAYKLRVVFAVRAFSVHVLLVSNELCFCFHRFSCFCGCVDYQ